MTCRSSPANPPPKLTWFIAGQQVSVNYHHHNHQHRHHNHHNSHHQQADMLYFWSTVHHHHLSKCPFHLFEKPDTAYETMFTKAQPQYPINISPDEQTNKCKGANFNCHRGKIFCTQSYETHLDQTILRQKVPYFHISFHPPPHHHPYNRSGRGWGGS